MDIVLAKDNEVMKWDSRLKDQLVYTVKESSGPIREAVKYKNDIGAILNVLQSTYLNGTEGLATLLNLESMRKKQPLDFGSSLTNIDYFANKCNLIFRLNMQKYTTSSILEVLVKFLFLSKDRETWEEKRVKSSKSRTMNNSQLKKTMKLNQS